MRTALRRLSLLLGVACVAIGLYHFLLGVWSVPGEAAAGATVDSRERFYNAVFLGYGLAWIWAARQPVLPIRLIRALAALFFAGGLGRLLSWALYGPPHWFQSVLTVIELALPPLYFWLSTTPKEAASSQRHPTR